MKMKKRNWVSEWKKGQTETARHREIIRKKKEEKRK